MSATPAVAPRGWSRLRRRLGFGLLGMVVLLGGLVLYALDPARQKAWLLPEISPLVEHLSLDYVRITPWSAEVKGLKLGAKGAEVALAKLELGFNPLALLMDTVSLNRLRIEGAEVNLEKFVPLPSTPDPAPFPGVLSAYDQGFAIALRDVEAKVALRLAGGQAVDIGLHGGGLRPHFPGSIGYTVNAVLGEGQSVAASGELMLDQLMAGALRKLGITGKLEVHWPGLPAAEHLDFDLAIAPQPGEGGARYRARKARHDRGTLPPPPPEALHASVRVLSPEAAERSVLAVDAEYTGEDGRVAGSFTLAANGALLLPYTGTAPLPGIAQSATGKFSFGSVDSKFDLDLANDVMLSDLKQVLGENPLLPQVLHARSQVTLAGQPERIAITRFEHSIAPDAAVPVVQAHLTAPLLFEPANPAALLATPQAFGVLEINDLPLPWVNGLLGDIALAGGTLRAGLEIAADEEQRLVATSITPLTTGPFTARQGENELFHDLALSVMPRFRQSAESLKLWLEELVLQHQGKQILGGEVRARHPFAAIEGEKLGFELAADLDVMRAMPALAVRLTGYPLPEGLTANSSAILRLKPQLLEVEALELKVAQTSAPELFHLKTEQGFSVGFAGPTPALHNPKGKLGQLSIRALDLAWVSPFIPDTHLAGRIEQAVFQLSGERDNVLALRSVSPLRLRSLDVEQGGHPMLSNVDVVTKANYEYRPEHLGLTLESLGVRAHSQPLFSGRLALGKALDKPDMTAEGKLAFDINQLLRQPVLAGLLGREAPALKMDGQLDFGMAYADPKVSVSRLDLKLTTDRKARVGLQAEPGLQVRTSLVPADQYAQAVIGSLNLEVRDFSSEVLKLMTPVKDVEFSTFNAAFRLSSDGSTLHAESSAPLRLESVRLTAEQKPLLDPFSVEVDAAVEAHGRAVGLDVRRLRLDFLRAQAAALDARFTAQVEPDQTIPLKTLKLELSAALPQWLSQPVVMPGHRLQAGTLDARIDINPTREIKARLGFDGLAGRVPLAIHTLELPVTGEVTSDGRGFNFEAPIIASGKSGASNATLKASFAPDEGENPLLDLRLQSSVFYLNDLLGALAEIAPPVAVAPAGDGAAKAPTAARAPTPLDESRDTKAAWDVLPYGTRLRFDIDKLFYTDYLAFDAVGGELNVRKHRLGLSDFSARFHESPITLDGGLRFKGEAPRPYTLALTGKVKDFDLQTFSSELVPGEKPQVEGLFGVDLEASGEMPNLGQLRNRSYFDIHMTSRDGVFRPLPPSSTLLIGASEVLGVVGEGLSYAPTGGFGAGAVARLVNYISRIDYDLIEIRVRRGKSQRVRLSRFLMQSPTILMSAKGAVDYVPAKDLLDSPLELKGSLDMLGRGAAILYSMNLMQDGRDKFGYYKGPEFLISGTPSVPESNFAAIIEQAGKGSVQGGVTRPLAGLIGNLKYRWFGPREKPQAVKPPDASELQE